MSRALVYFNTTKLITHLKTTYTDITFDSILDPYELKNKITEIEYDLIFFLLDLDLDIKVTREFIDILTDTSLKGRAIALFSNASGKESLISYAIKKGIHDFTSDTYGMSLDPETIKRLITSPMTRNDVKQYILDDDKNDEFEYNETTEKQVNIVQRQRVFSVLGNKGSGITELAINLGYTIAKEFDYNSVVIIDLDIKKADIALKLQTDHEDKSLHTLIDTMISNNLNNKVLREHVYKPNPKYNVHILNGFINIQEYSQLEPQYVHNLISICRNMFDVVILNTSGNMTNPIVKVCYDVSSHAFISLNANIPDLKYFKRHMLANEVSGIKMDMSKSFAVFSRYVPLKQFEPKEAAKSVGFNQYYTIRHIPEYNDYINEHKVAVLNNSDLLNDYRLLLSDFFVSTEQPQKRKWFFLKRKKN